MIVLALNSAIGVHAAESHSAHTVQHLLLITVAPVLLVLGQPLTLVRESSAHGREIVDALGHHKLVAVVTHPASTTACYAVVLVGTHLTGFPALARAEPWLHGLEEVLHLATGYLFALSLLGGEPLRWQPPYPARFGLVLFSMAVDTFVGIVLMMTPGPADLHLAGALMWFGGDGLMMAVALVIAARWLRDPDRSADTGVPVESARRAAIAAYGARTGTDSGAVLDSTDVDDEEARLAHHRILAALAGADSPHRR
jgi:putative copper resistance protein D